MWGRSLRGISKVCMRDVLIKVEREREREKQITSASWWLFCSILLWLYSPFFALGLFFSFVLIFYIDGGTPWKGDQPVVRPLPKHRTAQTQNKRTHIHASSGIRNHERSVRAGEDSSCIRPRGDYDRHVGDCLVILTISMYTCIHTQFYCSAFLYFFSISLYYYWSQAILRFQVIFFKHEGRYQKSLL
jgi:hypothetical protein